MKNAASSPEAAGARLYSRVEASRRLGLSVRRVRSLVSDGQLGDVVRLRGGVRQHLVPAADVDAMLRKRGMRRAPTGGEAAALAFEMFDEWHDGGPGRGDDRALLRAVVVRLRMTPERARELWDQYTVGWQEAKEAAAAADAAREEAEQRALQVREREALAAQLAAATSATRAATPRRKGKA